MVNNYIAVIDITMKLIALLVRYKLFLFVVLCGVLVLPTFLKLNQVDSGSKSDATYFNRNDSLIMWSSDFHISPIADIKHLLKDYNVKIIDKSLSGHCHLMNTCEKDLRVLNKQNGIRLSPCANQVRRDFFNSYVKDIEFNSAHAILCNHAAAMCEVFLPFDKPLIVIASTRYEIGRHDARSWLRWNENLKRLAANSRNVIAANNKYDAEYIKYFTGISNVQLLPNYCGYISTRYAPTKKEILLGPSRGVNNKISKHLYETLDTFNAGNTVNSPLTISAIRDLYPVHHEYSDISSHPAIVILPYQISFMSLFEFYRMEIPMFVPSPTLLAKWHLKYNILNERTWNTVYGSPSEKSALPRHPNSNCSLLSDPNNEFEYAPVFEWISLADFYVWPYITQFNSFEELFVLLSKLDSDSLKDISKRMHTYNIEEEARIRNEWINILAIVQADKNKVKKPLPTDVDTSLNNLYGFTLSKDDCNADVITV